MQQTLARREDAKLLKEELAPLYKGREDVKECGSYRGIKLISYTIKLLERIRKKVTIAEQ